MIRGDFRKWPSTDKNKNLNCLFTDPFFSRLFTVLLRIKQQILSKIFNDSRPVPSWSPAAVHITFWNLVYKEMKYNWGRNWSRARYNNVPDDLASLFTLKSGSRPSQRGSQFVIPHVKYEIGKQSFQYRGPTIWTFLNRLININE